jgi:plastocyanin
MCVAVALPVSANAATRSVTMGETGASGKKIDALGSFVNDYFPHVTTIHVGDRVKFQAAGFHSAEFPARGKDPAALLTPTGTKVAGVNDATGAPFWFNGQDNYGFNTTLLTGKFGKSVTLKPKNGLNSGLPLGAKPKPMTVKFTKAGTYTYFCNVHPGMRGSVKVVKASKKIPSAKAHATKVKAQYTRDLKIATALPKSIVPAGVVDVGVAGRHGVEFFGMSPAKLTISAGQSLQFRMTKGSFEAHTATFGPGDPNTEPDSYLGQIAKSFEGAPTIDPRGVYPSEPPTTTGTLTPLLHGNGFWNSGVMDTVAGSPPPDNNTVTFGAPGTYKFYCMIHPNMSGEIDVQ